MLKQKKNILFDLDGTLIDSKQGLINCLIETLVKYNYPTPKFDELDWIIGPPFADIISKINPKTNEDEISEIASYNRKLYGEKFLYDFKLYSGVEDLISYLSKDKKLFIATAKPQVYAIKILEKLKLDNFFHNIYGSSLDGNFEDKRKLIKHLIDSENLNKNETIHIGDRNFDVIAAKSNNIDSVGALWGYGQRSEIENSSPTIICNDIKELKLMFS